MRIVITGALGHIGSELIRSLRPGDATEVVLIDDLSTQRYCSLFNLPDAVPYRFIEANILTANLDQLLRADDIVVHLAALTNATASFENQSEVERVNLEGTERIALACVNTGARLIFLSTTSVYGVSDGVVDESADESQLQPQSPYATSKRQAELLLARLGREMSLKFVTCRFGTIYGISPGMRFHTAINKFVWQACMGLPLTVWRTALDQKRPYLDLRDGVRAIRFFIGRDLDNQIYNVLTDNATVGEIVDKLRELVPDLRVDLVESQIMNQLSYTVANEKIKGIGFQSEGNLATALAQSISLLKNARA